MDTNVIVPLPPKNNRIKGGRYIYKNNKIVIWSGTELNCEHNKQKSRCKECGGASICEHNKRKSICKECGGSSICKHNRHKSQCKECGGSSICKHNKRKSICKECDGSSICKHNRHKSICKECGGGSFCEHCKYITGTKRYISKTDTYEKLCADCFHKLYPDEKKIPTKYKRKQHYIHEKLKEKYGEDFFKYDIRVECGCSGKIPDWFVDCYNFVLNIECDENQHKRNDTSCETARLCKLFVDCAERPFVCIRFNPDNYKIEDKKIEGCFTFDEKNNIIVNQEEFEKRFKLLVENIDYYLENGSSKCIECIKLFYDS